MRNARRFWIALAVVSPMLFVGGCTTDRKPLPQTFRIKGTITYNNKPIEGATITFWPLPLTAADWKSVRPIAIVEPDGSFEPNSYNEHDGAVPGDYALTMICRLSCTSPDIFAGRFNDANHPILKVTIKPGENILPLIQLTGPEVNAHPPDAKSPD